MPDKALKFCRWPGCSELSSESYCPEHMPLYLQQYAKSRGSAASQGYDAQWQKVRLYYLTRHPLCEMCAKEGKTTIATLVHHKIPIKSGGARLDTSNLMSVCDAHHETIHGKDRWKRRE